MCQKTNHLPGSKHLLNLFSRQRLTLAREKVTQHPGVNVTLALGVKNLGVNEEKYDEEYGRNVQITELKIRSDGKSTYDVIFLHGHIVYLKCEADRLVSNLLSCHNFRTTLEGVSLLPTLKAFCSLSIEEAG